MGGGSGGGGSEGSGDADGAKAAKEAEAKEKEARDEEELRRYPLLARQPDWSIDGRLQKLSKVPSLGREFALAARSSLRVVRGGRAHLSSRSNRSATCADSPSVRSGTDAERSGA